MTKSTDKIILDDKIRLRLISMLGSVGSYGKTGDLTKLSNVTTYSKNQIGWALSGKTPLTHRLLKEICNACHISEQQVLYGADVETENQPNLKINMQVNQREADLVERWRRLNKFEQEAIEILLKMKGR